MIVRKIPRVRKPQFAKYHHRKKQQLAKNNWFYIFLMKMIIVIALLFSKWLLKGTTLVVVQIIQGNCAHFVFLNWRTCEWQRHLVSCFLPSSHNMMCHIRKIIWWIWGDIVKILLCQLVNTNKYWILRILQRNKKFFVKTHFCD